MLLVEMKCGGCNYFVPDSQPTIPGEGSCSDKNTGVKKTLTHWTPLDAAVNNGVFAGRIVPFKTVLSRALCFKNGQPDTEIPEKVALLSFLEKIPDSANKA